MSVPEHTVRRMKEEDLPQALAIWEETGMYQGSDSLSTWFQIDPNGMFVASTDDGQLLGTCAAVFSRDDLAFLGLYAVRPEYRGRGVGGGILKTALDYVGERNCALNTSESHLATYRDRAGFSNVTEWISIAYEKEGADVDCLRERVPGVVVVDFDKSRFASVVAYDAAVQGYCREQILRLTLKEADSMALVALRENGQTICGYGIIRKNVHGHGMVGPLYADDKDVAEAIFSKLIRTFPAARNYGVIYIPLKNNAESLVFSDKLNMNVFDVVSRLFKKETVPPAEPNKIWAQHDLNFCNF